MGKVGLVRGGEAGVSERAGAGEWEGQIDDISMILSYTDQRDQKCMPKISTILWTLTA